MDIVHIASELAPIAKVGGLGDVIYGLSKALVKKGHRVRVFLPKYDCLDLSSLEELQKRSNDFYTAKFHGIELVLIESPYFNRGEIYGEKDDQDRFLYFCKIASESLKKKPPDIVHLHDWPTAACSLFLQGVTKIIFTIHNIHYQGKIAPSALEPFSLSFDSQALRDPNEHDYFNLMKGAIHYSDQVSAVSPTYAWEILTPEGGFGLENTLLDHKKKLTGILNGIDTEYWDPKTDPHLFDHYSAETVHQGKKANKHKLQEHFHLPQNSEKPLIAAVTRLVSQKGPDLIEYGIQRIIELGGQFVLLGSSPDPSLNAQFEALSSHPDVGIYIGCNEPLAHKIYAASDMFLMPSIFEPCGLAQMIALRYGSIPLVRATGGLKDSIIDNETGFVFDIPDNKGVASAIERAFEAFSTEKWPILIENAMRADFSWEARADQYLDLYK